MKQTNRVRNLVLIGISVVAILFVSLYSGTFSHFVQSYGANVSFGFGMYFLLQFFKIPGIERIPTNAVYTLVFTGAQELAQFVGLNPGVFDPWDFLANAVGIGFAVVVDYLVQPKGKKIAKYFV